MSVSEEFEEEIMDMARSLALINDQGTDLERARLRCLLYKTPPEESVLQWMAEIQNIDGGFPCNMVNGNLSGVDTTLCALGWMGELGLPDSPMVEKATGFILDVQDEDGAWDEDRAIAKYDLPAWIKPGRPQTLVYLTAHAAFRLAIMGLEGESAFRRAVTYLQTRQEDTGKFYGALQSTWLAASVFAMDDPEGDHAPKALRYLGQKPAADWVDSQLASLLNALYPAGVPETHELVSFSLDQLLKRQQPDGGWIAEAGDAGRIDASIEVLRALLRYGRITP